MVIPKIVQQENKVLRQTAKDIPLADIGSGKINTVLKNMSEALASCDDGVALAAPQIGLPLRIFIVSGKIFAKKKGEVPPDMVFINPVIKKMSARKIKMEEGCLSVRWLYGHVRRADKVTVEAYNEKGNKFVKSGGGLLAQIFQHETDHLDGILFTDKATNVIEYRPET